MIREEMSYSINNETEKMLAQAKINWFHGDWEAITIISYKDIEKHFDRKNLILLVASAHQHLGNLEIAKKYFQDALEWGCSTKALAKICIADGYNTLGRIAVLQNEESQAERAFLASVDIGEEKDFECLAHVREVKEMATLGLLPQGVSMVDKKLKEIKNNPSAIKNIAAQTKVLETELELLTHQLNIGLQRNQLYTAHESTVNRSDIADIGSKAYIESLKQKATSQLGQDIWVLEKTNFKRGGFFVEFGATDGVLLSNTYLLEKEFDWKGICAEPNPKFFEKLQKNRNCIVSNECIGATTGEKVEFVFAQEYGGMQKHAGCDAHADKRKAYATQGNVAELTTVSLHDFLLQNNAPKTIDYLSIDTEGSEYEILENFPFDEWDVGLITVEHNNTPFKQKIFDLLSNKGFTRIEMKWDDWFYRNDHGK